MNWQRTFKDCNITFWLKFETADEWYDGKFSIFDDRSHCLMEDTRLGNWKEKVSEFIDRTGGDLTVKANSDTIPEVEALLVNILPP